MSNIWRLFRIDLKHLFANVVSCIIALGLVIMPSIFAWFNIIACWNVFENTGNIKVAVANTDAGYKSDLIPIEVNVGDMVVSALRANDQIDWVFTDEEDAVDGARSGAYYAAVSIPESFSRDMLTFYSDDMEHAQIVYYSNEKKNAISPKVTATGADTITYEVNQVFAKTLSEIALSLAKSISNYADDMDAAGLIGDIADHVDSVADGIERAASVIGMYSEVLKASKQTAIDCAGLIGSAEESISAASGIAEDGMSAMGSLGDAVSASADLMGQAMDSVGKSFDNISASIDNAFETGSDAAASAAADMRTQADALDGTIADYNAMADSLDALAVQLPASYQDIVRNAAERMRTSAKAMAGMQTALRQAADSLDEGVADASVSHEEAKASAHQAKNDIAKVRQDIDGQLKPGLKALASDASALASSLGGAVGSLGGSADSLISSTDSVANALDEGVLKIGASTSKMNQAAAKIHDVADAIRQALASGDTEALKAVLSSDATALASALAAPVGIERQAIYPSYNFGSAMAPFYSTLGIFIGSLLILVVVKPNVSKRAMRRLDNPKPRQLFLGRFCTMLALSLCQTTLMGLGNIFFLQVQVVSPWLLMLAFWTAGFVFTALIYSLVSAFANLGKAVTVILLIMQVTGCGGSYPLQILPGFVQALSPWLPATHVVNAMRSAMFGMYQWDYWIQLGQLLLFLIPAVLIGLVLRKVFAKFMHWYVEQVESTEVVC